MISWISFDGADIFVVTTLDERQNGNTSADEDTIGTLRNLRQ